MIDLPEKQLELLKKLCSEHAPGYEILAFGSRINGTSHPGSDLDLVIRDPAYPGHECAALPSLREAITASGIPILVDIFDWSLLPPEFREEIENRHEVIIPPLSFQG